MFTLSADLVFNRWKFDNFKFVKLHFVYFFLNKALQFVGGL